MLFVKIRTVGKQFLMVSKNRSLFIFITAAALIAIGLVYYFLEPLTDYIIYDIFGLRHDAHFTQSLHFFIYDTVKILILLFLISSLMGIVNAYFPVERLRNYLTTKKLFGFQYLLASFFGAVTPFCSCSSIPLFIGFVNGGIPLGVTLAFLITSPLVNEVAVAMFLGLFGVKATLIYAVSGILLGTVGGFLLGRMKLERFLSKWVLQMQSDTERVSVKWQAEKTPFTDRLPGIIKEGWSIVKKVLPYILLGIGIGAAIHGYIPADFFTNRLSADKWYAVPVAVVLAVPMYANAAGIVPVIQVFVVKGIPLGTAIAFMMAVVGLSLPEAALLKKVMQWKLILIFFATITGFIILLGYLFNWFL